MAKERFLKEYHNILTKDLPRELNKYLEVEEIQRLHNIGYFCGADYTNRDMYRLKFYYSTYDHSYAVASIVWHFTHDLTQTIASLLHDISSPVFRHAIDFMNGDSHSQESTEGHTERIIKESSGLVKCLIADGIDVEDVVDYKKYPIADNDRPRISADRLEGIFSNNYIWTKTINIFDIDDIYNNIILVKNEDNLTEMAFTDINIARRVFTEALILNHRMAANEDKLCMMMLAKITKLSIDKGLLTVNNLYGANEQEVVNLLDNVEDEDISRLWTTFRNMHRIYRSDDGYEKNSFYIDNESFKVKTRFVDPLVIVNNNLVRLMAIDKISMDRKLEADKFSDTRYACVPIMNAKVLVKKK